MSSVDLINQLEANFADPSGRRKGKVMKSVYKTFESETELIGWRFNEWDYGKPNSVVLPSQARGLFTRNNEIVVRGYDKFFSIDEVPTTRWNYILENTQGPYELSLKENGCILFVSGLESGELVVCSKHSTGFRLDIKRNHAEYGYNFLKNQLLLLNISPEELGKELFESKLTAVLELCDDDFEEHVLKYSKEEAGIYLHGLNRNTPAFQTLPMTAVYDFADKFGFKKVDFFVEKDPLLLKEFLEECSKTGRYNGKEVEGFVVRSKLKESNSDFFFKYKFEEPYLMYRQWRELTKLLLHDKSVSELNISKHKYQTLKYIEFVLPLLKADPQLREDYLSGHRIIELRDLYLQHLGKPGYEVAALSDNLAEFEREMQSLSINSLSLSEKKVKYVIVPVATIGCGKTTVALLLTHLFPSWGHIQNDNIPSPVRDKLVKGALDLLATAPCCIVDRNNHQYRERKQIFDDFAKFTSQYLFSSEYRLKFICLNFIKDKFEIRDQLWSTTHSRVLKRGDNHQSIKADKDGEAVVEQIMKGFIGRFQKVMPEKEPDSRFNIVIDLDVTGQDSSFSNLKKILQVLNKSLPELVSEMPMEAALRQSFQYALDFKPSVEKIIREPPTAKKVKAFKPAYFAVSLRDPSLLITEIENLLLTSSNEKLKVFYQTLKQLNRLQQEFHVTLVHVNSLKQTRQIYQNYTQKYFSKELQQLSGDPKSRSMTLPMEDCTIKLEKLCCTRSLLCLEVSISVKVQHQDATDKMCGNEFPHFTLGTIDDSVKAYQSNEVLKDINLFNCSEDKGYYTLNWDKDVFIPKESLELIVHR